MMRFNVSHTTGIAAFALLLTAAARADESAYDLMHRSYGANVAADNPLAWPTKVRAIARDEYHFWRGTRDLFYDWCRTNCSDWLSDRDAFVLSHGDLHFGNMGAYATGWNQVAIGLVDFDESARMPFQIELLQGLITLDLVAKQNKIDLTNAQRKDIHQVMFNAYRSAVASQKTTGEMLSGDPSLQALVNKGESRQYADDLRKYCDGRVFKSVVMKKGQPADLLVSLPTNQWEGFAKGIAEAIAHDARLAAMTSLRTASEIRPTIVAIARRTRVDSSGSQGLQKYLVRLHKPFHGNTDDVIIYLKEQIPSAPERAHMVSPDARSPGERIVEDADALVRPPMLADSWCEVDGHSYWVSVKEPWSDELNSDAFTTPDDLLHAARIWGIMAGASHQNEISHLQELWAPFLLKAVTIRADAYLKFEAERFATFTHDARTQADVAAYKAWAGGLLQQR